MYCKKCGQFLTGNENFCSNCGAKVEPQEPIKKQGDAQENLKYENSEPKTPSFEGIVWNTTEFPGSEPKVSKDDDDDFQFKWRSDDMFLHKEIVNEKPLETDMTNDLKDLANKKPEPEVQKVPKEEPKVVDVIQPSYSEPTVVEVEKYEPKEQETPTITVSKAAPVTESVPVAEEKPEPKIEVKPEVKAAEEVYEKPVSEETEKALIDEIAPIMTNNVGGESLDEDKKKIDKFYTFNRKKEEFQKLLDKAYDRMEKKCDPTGLEDDIAGFMDVERGTAVEGTTQLEEMVRARELFFDDPFLDREIEAKEEKYQEAANVVFEPETDESLADALEETENENMAKMQELIDEENAIATKDGFGEVDANKTLITEKYPLDDEEEEKTEEVLEQEVEKEPEEAQLIIDPKEEKAKEEQSTEELASDFFDDDDEDIGKGSKLLRVVQVILVVIVAAMISILAVRHFMPNSFISSYIDKFAHSAVSLFTGEKDTKGETANISAEDAIPEQDKTGLIQLEIKKNYQNSIPTIKYDGEAKYDSAVKYTFADFKDVKDIPDNIWYKKDNGEAVYYDQSIVGAIIAFESQKVAYINKDDNKVLSLIDPNSKYNSEFLTETKNIKSIKFDELDIGDIKVAADYYYVWVIETADGKATKKVYQLKAIDKKMVFTGVSKG